jgi:hypothetical protein
LPYQNYGDLFPLLALIPLFLKKVINIKFFNKVNTYTIYWTSPKFHIFFPEMFIEEELRRSENRKELFA